ncbi:hypothetical protein [Williamsia sp.]|uniref:hypothetical protein n=1 Tax=Williamsia sp. TaxID=1872085 RepID=UPI002F95492F
MNRAEICNWILQDSDPAIRWQVMRDLAGADPEKFESERGRIATGGWGKQLLELQDHTGLWGGGLYSPKWISTTYTLLLLQWFGLPAHNEQALKGCAQLWSGATFYDHGLTFAKTVPTAETCMTAMVVSTTAFFGHHEDRLDRTVQWLLSQQLDDGGWNCETLRNGSLHGSFHTSITVLESLLAYRNFTETTDVNDAIGRGCEFFLAHRLFKSHRTGEVVNPAFARFPFPPQWHFDVLRGLEFFRFSGAECDERLDDAVAVLVKSRGRDGRWPYHRPYPGRRWFALESAGPSKWSTLRCLRVLDWWDATF